MTAPRAPTLISFNIKDYITSEYQTETVQMAGEHPSQCRSPALEICHSDFLLYVTSSWKQENYQGGKTTGKIKRQNRMSPLLNTLMGIKGWQSTNTAENLLSSNNVSQTGPFWHYENPWILFLLLRGFKENQTNQKLPKHLLLHQC